MENEFLSNNHLMDNEQCNNETNSCSIGLSDKSSKSSTILSIPQNEMKTLFIKLASNSRLRTLKETDQINQTPTNVKKEIGFDSLWNSKKEGFIFDDKITVNDIINKESQNKNISIKAKNNKMRISNKVAHNKSIKTNLLKTQMINSNGAKTARITSHNSNKLMSKSGNTKTRNNKKLNNSCIINSNEHKQIEKKENLSYSGTPIKKINAKSHSDIKKKNDSLLNAKKEDDYDYNKILIDLKSIFGNDLEYFDENLLFRNLDETSNKGLIKGLLMLAHQQEKKIVNLNKKIKNENENYIKELKNKNELIDILNLQVNKMNSLLKGFITENEKVIDNIKKYK